MKVISRLGTHAFVDERSLKLAMSGYSVKVNDQLRIWAQINLAAAMMTRQLFSSTSACRSAYHLSDSIWALVF